MNTNKVVFETSSLPPSLNRQYIHTRQGFVALSSETKNWRKAFALEFSVFMRRNRIKKIDKPNYVYLNITLHLVRDRDIDNFVKSIFDALQGVLFDNDSQVVYLQLRKYKVKTSPQLFITILDK